MSDHLSSPRALAGPTGDICDLDAFPSPDRPGRLVLAMTVLPVAVPDALFADAILCRFRLRPLTIKATGAATAFTFGNEKSEIVFDYIFDAPATQNGGAPVQTGRCIPLNPRDATVIGEVRLHRIIRRGTSYGPPLPEGVLEDDGADRGIMFAFVGANLTRQFEFVQMQWVNDGKVYRRTGGEGPVCGPTFALTIVVEDGKLIVQPTGQEPAQLFPESETKFFLTAIDAQIEFQKDEVGAVTGLLFHQGDQEFPGKKTK